MERGIASSFITADLSVNPPGICDPREYNAAHRLRGARWIEFVSELPKTATGKIRRFRLRS